MGFPGGELYPQNMRARETKARVPIRNLTPSVCVPRSMGTNGEEGWAWDVEPRSH